MSDAVFTVGVIKPSQSYNKLIVVQWKIYLFNMSAVIIRKSCSDDFNFLC